MGLCHTAAILSQRTEKALFYHPRPGNEELGSEVRVVKQSYFGLSGQYGRHVLWQRSIDDRLVPSNDPRNNSGKHFGSSSLLLSKLTNSRFILSNVGASGKVFSHWSQKTITHHCLSLFPTVSRLGYRTNWLLGLGELLLSNHVRHIGIPKQKDGRPCWYPRVILWDLNLFCYRIVQYKFA